MLTFPYETSEFPPAPYIDLQVSALRQSETRTGMRAKLDSGASLTVIPQHLVREWNLVTHEEVRVLAYNDTPTVRPVYYVDLRIGTRWFAYVPVIASERRNILLGRNVLNQLSITHDGPRQTVRIHYLRKAR